MYLVCKKWDKNSGSRCYHFDMKITLCWHMISTSIHVHVPKSMLLLIHSKTTYYIFIYKEEENAYIIATKSR